jgi:hypothetical protein
MAEIPSFAALLAPYLARFEEPMRPVFLAALERGAAARYRAWAEEAPGEAEGLRACADREEEIARTAEGLFPPDDATRKRIAEVFPEAARAYAEVFTDVALRDQWRIQASAEREGAAAWRALAAAQQDATVVEALERCATLEEESALHLDKLVAQHGEGSEG